MKRRHFISLPLWSYLAWADLSGLTDLDWRLIAAVQDHLFPDEPHAPGAVRLNATHYLRLVLNREPESAPFFAQGAAALRAFCRTNYQQSFLQLNDEQKENCLRQFEQQGGKIWLHRLIYYILEAGLTDPVYGGNPHQIGWHWLEHRPGYRRPPKNKRYFLIRT